VLLYVLAICVLGVLLLIPLAQFTNTSQSTTDAYRSLRDDRYAGDGAIKTAVNWAKNQTSVGVDPTYNPAAGTCFYEVPTPSGTVSVSCATPADASGAGVPADQGLVPPESLLLLGARHTEPGPYSYSQCGSLWDSVVGWFTGTNPGTSESGLRMEKARRSSGFGVLSCVPRNRGNGPLTIQGQVVSAGRISVRDGLTLNVVGTPGTVRARYGCDPANVGTPSCTAWPANGLRSAPGMPWDGTPLDSDPGRLTPISVNPIGNIRNEFLPIGFNADGTVRSGYSFPERTTAYRFDPAQNTAGTTTVPKNLVAVAQCTDVPAGTPIIFLPGWYRDSEVLSRYTANAACPDRTFWFAPDAGADRALLTADDRTGAYYLDFTGATGRGCGEMTAAVPARWCLGGSAASSAQASSNSKPRVVVGWPKDWAALPTGTATGSGTGTSPAYGSRVGVNIPTAGTVEGSFLTYWSNLNNAKVVDGQYATYRPCTLLFGLINCPSFGSRTLRLNNYTPKVTSGPIGETTAPAGRLFVEVNYGLKNPDNLNTPQLVVETLDPAGAAKNCGTYTLTKTGVTFSGSGALPSSSKYTFTNAQAEQLASACGSVSDINNMRLTLQVGGNVLNTNLPEIYLDGARIFYDSYQGASFPVGTDGLANSNQPARSDCDRTKPGGQLIFGGESHVYVADGSIEVCAGPDPDAPATRQVIGIYGVPAVETLRPTSVTLAGGNGASMSPPTGSPALAIGEPGGRQDLNITYNRGFFSTTEGRVALTFPAYSVPPGYRVARVDARASYDSNNPGAFLDLGSNAQLRSPNCADVNMPLTGDPLQAANLTNGSFDLRLFVRGSRNCFGTDGVTVNNPLATSRTLTWAARGYDITGIGTFTDQLDGVELDVWLEPIDPSVPRLRPQTGCITAHPNYTGGESRPDCALVRADSFTTADSREGLCITNCTNLRGYWAGRISVKGTIYAPSAAVEVDDNDIAYPLATRGAILRHLRVSGVGKRTGYTDPMIGGTLDQTPTPRQAVFTACIQEAADRAARTPCGSGSNDRVLTAASVTFQPVGTGPTPQWAPIVNWWSDRRRTGGA
jgi:hypothetical protein